MSSAFAAIPKAGPFSEEDVELLNRNKFYAEDLDHAGILAAFDPIFAAYAARCEKGERFGDFCIRAAPLGEHKRVQQPRGRMRQRML